MNEQPAGTNGRPAGRASRIWGLLVGTKVELVRFAPMADPVEIKVRGDNQALREHEAERILVKLGI